MGVGHMGTQLTELDLLGKSPSATHNCRKEPSVTNLPQLESQINCGVAGQIVALGVEAETGDILGVAL